jgi:hypothetical protein
MGITVEWPTNSKAVTVDAGYIEKLKTLYPTRLLTHPGTALLPGVSSTGHRCFQWMYEKRLTRWISQQLSLNPSIRLQRRVKHATPFAGGCVVNVVNIVQLRLWGKASTRLLFPAIQ